MRSRMIFYITGTVLPVFLPELLSLIALVLLFLSSLYLLIGSKRISLTLSGFFLLGLISGSLWGHWQVYHRLANDLARSDWYVEGVVTEFPELKQGVMRLNLQPKLLKPLKGPKSKAHKIKVHKALKPHSEPEKLPALRLIRLSWYQPDIELLPGQTVKLNVRLKPPHGMLNPEGFDYERWLLSRGFDATGYVRRFIEAGSVEEVSISQARHWLNQKIKLLYQDERHQALVMAIITGSRTLLADQDWENLKRSGATHLAVISGLHIGFVAFLGWLLAKYTYLFFRIKESRLAVCLCPLFLTAIYVLIAGAQLPVQRAFIMLLVFLLSSYKLLIIDPWDRWLLAMAAVVTFSPLAFFEKGFWLSFVAVALLIHLSRMELSRWQLLKLQWFLLLGMLPLYSLFFNAVSLVAPFVNILLIPLMSLIVPLVFLDLLSLQASFPILHSVVEWLLSFFWYVVDFAAEPQWSYITTQNLNMIGFVFILLAAIIFILPLGRVGKMIGLCCLLPLFFETRQIADKNEEFSAWVYDVGQGLAVLLRVDDYYLLYDTGPGYHRGGSAFKRQILPHLNSLGVTHLNSLVLSHNDIDHVGGWKDLNTEIMVSHTYSSYPLKPFSDLTSPHSACENGISWQQGLVSFQFISGSKGGNDNERSCVLLIKGEHCSLLLPGDIGIATERQLPSGSGSLSWLIAPHHGSRYSTSEYFLDQWQPRDIIYSAGYANHFNHPHPDVLSRANIRGIDQYNTADKGAIFLQAGKDGECVTQAFRTENKRYWR